ncbi:MAG: hypothetical protein EA402_12595 [Planctomycetota bacterium]|nr:MAG: hypothetical protein EA402_12595 [Planctomycetota bacterium]
MKFTSAILGLLLASAALPLSAAEPEIPEPGLPPLPRLVPLVPDGRAPAQLDPEDALLQNLQQAIAARDERIRALMDRASGDLPRTGQLLSPEASEQRDHRNSAWRELEATLNAMQERQQRQRDILDTPALVADEYQIHALRASNHLAMARSYKSWLEDLEEAPTDKLRRGLDVSQGISVEHLEEHLRPQRLYLIFWFASELTSRLAATHPEESRDHLDITRRAHERLVSDWPGSVSLIISANTLLNRLHESLGADPSL